MTITPFESIQGPRNREDPAWEVGWGGGDVPPHNEKDVLFPFFVKNEKVSFFRAKVPHLKNEKSISFAGKKVPFLQ